MEERKEIYSEENLKSTDDAIKGLLIDMAKNQKKVISKLVRIIISLIVGYTVIILGMVFGFFYYESQFEFTDEVTEEITTITQEVSGTDSEINNVEGNLYKDNATHNEGGE